MRKIGEGSYGCVYTPPKSCGKGRKRDMIGKIFENKQQYEEEKIIMKIVQKIDPQNKYTLKMIDNCQVDNTDIKSCKHYKNGVSKYYQIVYKYGGIDLESYIKEGNYKVKDVLPGIIGLLKLLKKMENKGYVHRDIRESNILVDDGKLYLIDFGLMISYDKIYDDEQDYVLQYNYKYYPPEFKIYYNAKMNTRLSSIKDLTKFTLSDVKQNYIDSDIFLDIDGIKDELENVYYSTNLAPKFVKGMLMYYANKIDVFSLGMVCIRLILNTEKSELKCKVFEILEHSVDPSPVTRWDAAMLIKSLSDLV